MALDGTDGLRIAAATHPDLILLDIRMPGLDGIAVCERLQCDAATRHIPVIFLTALADIDDKGRSFGAAGQFDADHQRVGPITVHHQYDITVCLAQRGARIVLEPLTFTVSMPIPHGKIAWAKANRVGRRAAVV